MKDESSKKKSSPVGLLLLGGAVVAGWIASHLGYRRLVQNEAGRLRGEIQWQKKRLEELEQQLQAEPPAPAQEEAITPETLAVIAAAVTAFLGKKVKIHSARLINPEVVSPWAQQGRVSVQASHNYGRR